MTSADGYSLDAGSTLGTINLDGGTATLAAALTLNGGSLSFGALSTDTAALTVNSVAGTGATALQIGRPAEMEERQLEHGHLQYRLGP